MTPNRRGDLLRLYHLALTREGHDRTVLLDEACGGEGEMRGEVESLLAHEPPDDFPAAPALGASPEPPAAAPADRLGEGPTLAAAPCERTEGQP